MRPFLGLVARRILILYVITWCVHNEWLLPLYVFNFHRVYSNTLDICLHWLFSCCLFVTVSRDPILWVPSIYFVQASCSCFTDWIPRRSRCCPLIWRFCRALLVPCYLFILVNLLIYRKECLATSRDLPGSLVPAICHFHLVTKKVSWGFFLDLQQAYSDVRLS